MKTKRNFGTTGTRTEIEVGFTQIQSDGSAGGKKMSAARTRKKTQKAGSSAE